MQLRKMRSWQAKGSRHDVVGELVPLVRWAGVLAWGGGCLLPQRLVGVARSASAGAGGLSAAWGVLVVTDIRRVPREYGVAYGYTPSDDAEIDRLRLAGMTWADIAVSIGRPRQDASCVRQRAYVARLSCVMVPRPTPPPAPRNPRLLAGSEPLRAMHPLAWSILCEAEAAL